jgi:glycosyltransferase involved in cell wall biosynthesis
MAAGKAVIASAVAGTNEAVVHGETGILVAPRDPVALAGAVRELLDERVRRERFGAAGAERATREFSAETLITRITAIYEDVLAGSRKVLASA